METTMSWTRTAILLSAALVAVVVASFNSPVRADESANLDLKYTVGLRRSVDIARKYTEISENMAVGEVAARTTRVFTRNFQIHEWYTDLKDGQPSRFVRTYQKADRALSTESYIKFIDNTTKLESTGTDFRSGQILTLERGDEGKLKLVDGAANLVTDKVKQSVIDDVETDLLPHAAKKAGDTWTIAGAAVENLMDAEDSVLIDTTT
jgi:hypothetical protein